MSFAPAMHLSTATKRLSSATRHLSSAMELSSMLREPCARARPRRSAAGARARTAPRVAQRIDACSAVIKAGRDKGEKLAEAFNNRAWRTGSKATSIAPSRTTARRSSSTRKFAAALQQSRRRLRPQGRIRSRHPGLRSGDQAQAFPGSLFQSRQRLSRARANMTMPSTTTIRRSGSRPISRRPMTTVAGRGRWWASSSRRSPTAMTRCA